MSQEYKKYYGGWLYANKDEYDELKEIGVFGPMIYTPDEGEITKALEKEGSISQCYCNHKSLLKLQKRYEEVWRTKYPYWTSDNVYPHFSEVSKEKIKQLKQIHYHWNDEI